MEKEATGERVGAVNKAHSLQHLLLLKMSDGPLMLRVNLPKVDTIHPCNKKFVMGVMVKVRGGSNLMTALKSITLTLTYM